MKRKIVIAILCAAVSMGTVGCGNSTASAKTTQTQTDKKEDSKSENSEKSSEEKQSRDIFAMDTYMTVTAYGEHASKAVDKAETEIKRLDGMLSTGNENSEVYKLNQNGEAVVSDDTAYLYERSEKIYKQTKGVFDISIYPVMDAWGFTTENYRIPAEDELSALLKNVDASKIQYDKKTKKITLPKNVKIDFGGIAKGYTSSRIMQIYKKCGVTSGLVSLGGNVQLLGAKPDGSAWKVAVESPEEDGNYLGILQAKDKAVITSGGYERYFEKNGKKYHHIIDPSTGYPAENGLTSVTIISDDGTLADGLSTSLFIMGKEKAEKFWKKYNDKFDVILLTDDEQLYVSEGIADDFQSDYKVNVMKKVEAEDMDKEKVIKKIKQGAPATSAIVVAACIGVSLSGYQAPVYEAQAQTKETKTTDAEEAKKTESKAKGSFDLADGIYKGTGTGYAGEVTVAVTIKDKQITAIDILSSSDDAAFFNRAKAVIDRIIVGQTLDVDVVSGATFSSNGIISAVKNALTGEKDSGETGESQSGNAAVQGSTLSLADVQDAAAYKDGTYYGTGTGFGGTLKVKVVISRGKITSIEVVENHDDSSYLNRAEALIGNIISSQSTNVDVISGATYSSNGIKSAVRDALRQAAVSGNSQSVNAKTEDTSKTEDNTTVKGNFPYKEGIYYGTAEGYNGEIEVAVVLQDKSIKAVLVTKNHDDEKFFNRAMDVVKNVMKNRVRMWT